jgi:ligand-binding sensor domain-containing protein
MLALAVLSVVTSTRDVRAVAFAEDGTLVAATAGGLAVGDDVVPVGAARALRLEGGRALVTTAAGVVAVRLSDRAVLGVVGPAPAQRADLVWGEAGDARGKWVATSSGLVRYEGRRRVKGDAAAAASRLLPVTDVRAVIVVDGEPVVGTFGAGAFRWDGRRWTPVGPARLRVSGLAERAGTFALATDDGVAVVDALGQVAWRLRGGLPANDVAAVAAAPDGGVWVGLFDAGLARLAADGRVVGAWREADGLLDDRVNALAIDASRRGVWIATERGLAFRGDAGGFRAVPPYGRHVNTVAVVGERVFCGLPDGLWELAGNRLVRLDDFPLPRVTSIGPVAAEDGLPRFVGSAAGLAVRGDAAWSVIGAAGGQLPEDWVTALAPLPDGGVLAGTYQGGVHRVRPDGSVVAVSLNRAVNPNALFADAATILAGTLEGGLWIGPTLADGGAWVRLGGLPSADVTGVARAGGALWIATRGGVVVTRS